MGKSTWQWLVKMAPLLGPLAYASSRGHQTALRPVPALTCTAHDSSLENHQRRRGVTKENYFWHALRDCRGYSSLPAGAAREGAGEAEEGMREGLDGEGESWKQEEWLYAAERKREQEMRAGVADVDWLKLTDRELQVQCRVETLRSSGPGGQHRNKTESAVRLLHLPTGLVAFAAEDRSQHKNRTKAFKRLREVIAMEGGQWNWRDI